MIKDKVVGTPLRAGTTADYKLTINIFQEDKRGERRAASMDSKIKCVHDR